VIVISARRTSNAPAFASSPNRQRDRLPIGARARARDEPDDEALADE